MCGDLKRRDAAKQHQDHKDGDRADEEDADLQHAAQDFPQNDFIVAQIGHEQEEKGPAIFLLGDRARGGKCREE